jgi:hypothetical protein
LSARGEATDLVNVFVLVLALGVFVLVLIFVVVVCGHGRVLGVRPGLALGGGGIGGLERGGRVGQRGGPVRAWVSALAARGEEREDTYWLVGAVASEDILLRAGVCGCVRVGVDVVQRRGRRDPLGRTVGNVTGKRTCVWAGRRTKLGKRLSGTVRQARGRYSKRKKKRDYIYF